MNEKELKEWIINHIKYFRGAIKRARANEHRNSELVFEGHIHAMRLLWNDIKTRNELKEAV